MTEAERQKFIELLALAPYGPRIEFGVYRGASLALIAADGQRTIGVDTFQGMPEPGPHDKPNGGNPYPKGRFKVPMNVAADAAPTAHLVRGWVPGVLSRLRHFEFAFAHLDIDHYEPTWILINWLWPRMQTGGVMVCDDWFADRDCLAAKAINQFGEKIGAPNTFERKAWWIK